MKRWWIGLLALTIAPVVLVPVIAQDSGEPPPSLAPQSHFGSSPFDPDEARDDTFVVDRGPDLDTGCTFRGGGPLIIHVPITRHIGPVDGEGYLLSPGELVAAGVVRSYAALRMPAWDVDYHGGGGQVAPERDRVSFNGQVLSPEFLVGDNNTWVENTVSIPIERLRFPADPGVDGSITPRMNEIRIDIDTANTNEYWCTSIDWASIQIEAARPVLLVHGIFSDYVGAWGNYWIPQLPTEHLLRLDGSATQRLDMGWLDSIANNASKVGSAVQQMRMRWGVDRVNIVAHSKGGLDSREWAETHGDVETLMQIATPNAGSPLADAAQLGSVALFGLVSTAIIDGLAAPAGWELTTWHMSRYNATHGHNRDVQYYAKAGDYTPDCGVCDWFLRALYGGDSDTIVPVWSVYGLSYLSAFPPLESAGQDSSATHTEINNAPSVFDDFLFFLKRWGTPLPSRAPDVHAPSASEGLAQIATFANTVGVGETRTGYLFVESQQEVALAMLYAQGNLDLALFAPDGTRIDHGMAGGPMDVSFGAEEGQTGAHFEVYRVQQPVAGLWRAEVTGVTLPTGIDQEPFFVQGWLQAPPITLGGSLSTTDAGPNRPLAVAATVSNGGNPVHGATVTARVVGMDFVPVDFELHDQGEPPDAVPGDGTYTGTFVGVLPQGPVRVRVSAAGPPELPFSREMLLQGTWSSSQALLSGIMSDRGVDQTGDGLFDFLRISVGVDVTSASELRLFGRLLDSADSVVGETTVVVPGPLGIGTHTVHLDFDGSDVSAGNLDGPYRLVALHLGETAAGEIVTLDELETPYVTATYLRSEFQRPEVRFTGGGADMGIDINGNGRFDQLQVDVEVDVLHSGYRNWTVQLNDSGGRLIDFDSGAGVLTQGINTIRATFEGSKIGANGVDGPYTVGSVLIYGGGPGVIGRDVYTTAGYDYTQFEGAIPRNQPPVAEAGPDRELECQGMAGSMLLDGSGSTDPDSSPGTNDDIVDFEWREDGVVVATGAQATLSLPLGAHTIELTVTDVAGANSTDAVTITVQDTLAPTINCPVTVVGECMVAGSAELVLTADGSDECYGTVVIHNSATDGGSDASGTYPLGSTGVTFTATDGSGLSATCATSASVYDTTPPVLTVDAAPNYLWPPNHTMYAIHNGISVFETCDSAPVLVLERVVSSEPDDVHGGGDGNTTDDIQEAAVGTDDVDLWLRAERQGSGPGRTYTLSYRVTDASGNTALAQDHVAVPHDQDGIIEPVVLKVENPLSTVVTWEPVYQADHFDVIRGRLEDLSVEGSDTNLGPVMCLVQSSTMNNTLGSEDTALPDPGHAFFYLVQFNDGTSESSYGSSAATKARVLGAGSEYCH